MPSQTHHISPFQVSNPPFFTSLNPSEGSLASALVRLLRLNSWYRFQLITDRSSHPSRGFTETIYRLTIGSKYSQAYHTSRAKSTTRYRAGDRSYRRLGSSHRGGYNDFKRQSSIYEEFLTDMRRAQSDQDSHQTRHRRHEKLRLKRHLSQVRLNGEQGSIDFAGDYQHHHHHHHEDHNHNANDSFLMPPDSVLEFARNYGNNNKNNDDVDDVESDDDNDDDDDGDDDNRRQSSGRRRQYGQGQPLNRTFLRVKVENLIRKELEKRDSSAVWELEDHVQLPVNLTTSTASSESVEDHLRSLKESESRVVVMHTCPELAKLVFKAAAKIGLMTGYTWLVSQQTISTCSREFMHDWISSGILVVVSKSWSLADFRKAGHSSGNQRSKGQGSWQLIKHHPSMAVIIEALRLSSRSIRARHGFGHGSPTSGRNLKLPVTKQFAGLSKNLSSEARKKKQFAENESAIVPGNVHLYDHRLEDDDDDYDDEIDSWNDGVGSDEPRVVLDR